MFLKRVFGVREESVDEYLERTPDWKLDGYDLQRKKRIKYPPQYASMSHEERLNWQKAHITKPWCVCQDMRPFLILFVSQHDSEEEARRASQEPKPLEEEQVDLTERIVLALERNACALEALTEQLIHQREGR